MVTDVFWYDRQFPVAEPAYEKPLSPNFVVCDWEHLREGLFQQRVGNFKKLSLIIQLPDRY